MSAEEVEQLEEARAPSPAQAPPPVAYGPQPADPRLYRFFWCAMACVIGTLMPFTSENPLWDAESFNSTLEGPAGYETFYGALLGFFALLSAAQYSWCIKFRKVKVWPILVMLPIAFAAWVKFVSGLDARLAFAWKGKDLEHEITAVPGSAWIDMRFWNSMFQHIGTGWFLVLLGSTAFFVVFILAVAGVGGTKTAAAPRGRR